MLRVGGLLPVQPAAGLPCKGTGEGRGLEGRPGEGPTCSPPGPSIHGIFQARVLEWGAIAFSEIPYICVTPAAPGGWLFSCVLLLGTCVHRREREALASPLTKLEALLNALDGLLVAGWLVGGGAAA